ncbi:MAG: MBOAT family O-acyltransferase [Erysipelotrichaceae bacterium]|nr:MBOAT family O-acyltransferase [Erysipelotrichaceae bacterium]
MLFVFKYDSTFVGRLIMPLGISFYIFKIVSYLNDIYKEKIECEFNPILYLDYVMFFPCITAGPINRAKDFFEELKSKHEFEYTDISTGFFMLAVGLFEKVVVCDFIKTVTIRCLDNVELTGINVLLGVILYSFEIYLDFDSYSNIAIGIARMLGFKLKKNFNVPYLSAGIKDFWNRWHISLSSWLKDYIYIPLGGSRKGIVRQYLNILIVFLFSSLWHGMTVNFVIWGMGHAVFRVLEDTFERYVYPGSKNKFIALFEKLLKIVLTFVLVTILWVFFRYQNVNDALAVFNRIIDGGSFSYETIGLTLMEFKWLVILVVSVILSDLIRYFTDIFEFMGKRIFILRWALYVVMILVFLVFGVYGGGAFEAGDFIYKWF